MTAKKYIYPKIIMPHKLFTIYKGMIARCYDSDHLTFKNYGGKGIKVCDIWVSNSKTFYYWALGNGYKEGLTLDRVNSELDYSPDNCRFITMSENIQTRTSITKLNADKVRQVRKDFNLMTTREVAKKWGMGHRQIMDIKSRKAWGNVED